MNPLLLSLRSTHHTQMSRSLLKTICCACGCVVCVCKRRRASVMVHVWQSESNVWEFPCLHLSSPCRGMLGLQMCELLTEPLPGLAV